MLESEEEKVEIVILNVGGKRFTTYKHTILSIPQGLLSDFFTQNYYKWVSDEGDYFFDRNPKLFAPILEFYRTGILSVPENISFSALWREVVYFGLDKAISKSQIEMHNNVDDCKIEYPASWASSMAGRIAPLLKRAFDMNLLQFSVIIDSNGLYKGIPSALLKNSSDKAFWTDFCISFAKAPPGSVDDFSMQFLHHFQAKTSLESNIDIVSLCGDDCRETISSKNISWVLFRMKPCRVKCKQIDIVDRRKICKKDLIGSGSINLQISTGWQLDFSLPQTVSAMSNDCYLLN
jgi:hypothetical protein